MDNNISLFEHPELNGSPLFLKGNQVGVLLIHGFTATTVEVRNLAYFLHDKGLTVSAPLLPGHGTTPQDLNNKIFSDWSDCIEAAFLSLKKTCISIIVGGESMGAVLALYLAGKHPEIKAILLYSPAIIVPNLKFSKILSWLKPIISKTNSDEMMLWQGYSVYPLFAAREFLKLQRLVVQKLPSINQPVIIFQGAYDKTIDQNSGNLIFSSVNSRDRKFILLKNSGHVILLDKDFSLAAKETWKFLNSQKIV